MKNIYVFLSSIILVSSSMCIKNSSSVSQSLAAAYVRTCKQSQFAPNQYNAWQICEYSTEQDAMFSHKHSERKVGGFLYNRKQLGFLLHMTTTQPFTPESLQKAAIPQEYRALATSALKKLPPLDSWKFGTSYQVELEDDIVCTFINSLLDGINYLHLTISSFSPTQELNTVKKIILEEMSGKTSFNNATT